MWTIENNVLTTGRLRSNSRTGDSSWIAEITGVGGKYGLVRQFIKATHNVTGNANGTQSFILKPGTIYEYRNIWLGESAHSYGKYGGSSGFFRLTDSGDEVSMTLADVTAAFSDQETETG